MLSFLSEYGQSIIGALIFSILAGWVAGLVFERVFKKHE